VSIILDQRLWFPDPRQAISLGSLNGFIAVGGDLSSERLLLAYRTGIFPWSVDPITWWSPDPRGIIPLDRFHASRSLQRQIRRGSFRTTFNHAFRQVIEGCAAPASDRPSSWITPEFISAYEKLHMAGHAHSVESWLDDQLVGGVYGVQVGGLFAGESMFHRVPDASKVALARLVDHLRARNFRLLDIQMVTPHTSRLGAIAIPREKYLKELAQAVQVHCLF
jgi:leucyl/phenylalanyl-tRNA--protein transferase